MTTAKTIFLIGLVGAAALTLFAGGNSAKADAPVKTARKAKMRIELAVEATRFVVGESVDCLVRYVNDGPAPLTAPEPVWEVNWQPRFTLTGPAYPNGLEFTPRSAVLNDPRPEPTGIEPVLTEVAPGATFEQPIPLDRWVSLEEPGDYTLTAALRWQERFAASEPVAFQMEGPAMQSVSLGCVVGANTRLLDGAWLQKKGDHCLLFQLTYTEDRPDLGEMSRPESRKMLETGPDATDILAPYRNVGRTPSFHFWYAWREGKTLLARSFLLKAPLKLDLSAVPAQIVRPALMTSKGELDVFLLAEGGKTLHMASFPPPDKDGGPVAPSLRWKMPLPLPVSAARCALDGRKDSENRRIVLAAQDGDNIALTHVLLTPGQPSAAETVQLRNAYLMPGTQIGFRIDAEGVSHVSLLYETNRETRAFSLTELAFGADGKRQGPPTFQKLGALPAAPQACAVAFQQMGAEPARRAWVVLMAGEKVVSSANPAGVSTLHAPAALPLELLARSQAAYLMTLDPKSGPAFVSLP